ncbi:hypothetical protein ONS95_007286 [Cadophora gregata]|uniref:uncharacterized protein n=1 Tax=Cadophora gregata TaxID=51156 RepID=UPI0026DA9C9E|nr:uncharacterized protein ONS95_007286 [Cadophora gregata]KAK0100839.1 hypothetical protein ONS95_007286 [Cadophora gregata]KAK0117169.1 hypothetical protein ONS96_013002 [Cadophora gregata f. sp. sojae]
MSCGVKISNINMVIKLARSTLKAAKKAYGEDDEFTEEILSLHLTLELLRSEVTDPESMINKHKGGRRKDFETYIASCRAHLRRIKSVLRGYNRLKIGSGSVSQRIQFGTAGVKEISDSQLKLSTYTTVITLTLNLLSLGSQGRVEKELSRLRGEAKRLRPSINLLLAKQNALSREETKDESFRAISQDDWKLSHSFIKHLEADGFKRSLVRAHKNLIIAYIKELSERGLLDEKTLRVQNVIKESLMPKECLMDGLDSEACKCHECIPPSHRSPASPLTSDRRQDGYLNRDHQTPRSKKRTSSKIYQGEKRDILDISHSPAAPKQKSFLSILLFSPKRKSKRPAPSYVHPPQEALQPRKRQKRTPPPPRPVSPTPPPPDWWLEERLRRRPVGYERGRSPTPRYNEEPVYSRTMAVYPDVSYGRWGGY